MMGPERGHQSVARTGGRASTSRRPHSIGSASKRRVRSQSWAVGLPAGGPFDSQVHRGAPSSPVQFRKRGTGPRTSYLGSLAQKKREIRSVSGTTSSDRRKRMGRAGLWESALIGQFPVLELLRALICPGSLIGPLQGTRWRHWMTGTQKGSGRMRAWDWLQRTIADGSEGVWM